MKGSGWRIAMIGHDADLRDASLMFDSTELNVSQTNDEYFLESSHFDPLTDAGEVLAWGVELLRLANGIAKTRSKAFEGLSLSYVAKENPDGTQQIHQGLYTDIRVLPEGQGVLSDGTPILPNLSMDVTKLVAATKQQDVVSRALTIYGALGDSWRGLYMVLDAIQQEAGGEGNLLNAGWLRETTSNSLSKLLTVTEPLGSMPGMVFAVSRCGRSRCPLGTRAS